MSSEVKSLQFSELGLAHEIEKVIKEIGYETPSPIQAESIPATLSGRRKRAPVKQPPLLYPCCQE